MRRMGLGTKFRGKWPEKQSMRDLVSFNWNKEGLFIFPGKVGKKVAVC